MTPGELLVIVPTGPEDAGEIIMICQPLKVFPQVNNAPLLVVCISFHLVGDMFAHPQVAFDEVA